MPLSSWMMVLSLHAVKAVLTINHQVTTSLLALITTMATSRAAATPKAAGCRISIPREAGVAGAGVQQHCLEFTAFIEHVACDTGWGCQDVNAFVCNRSREEVTADPHFSDCYLMCSAICCLAWRSAAAAAKLTGQPSAQSGPTSPGAATPLTRVLLAGLSLALRGLTLT